MPNFGAPSYVCRIGACIREAQRNARVRGDVGVVLPASQYGAGDAVIQILLARTERQLVDAPTVIDEFKVIAGNSIIFTGIVVVLEGRVAEWTVFHAVEATAGIVQRFRPREPRTKGETVSHPLVYPCLECVVVRFATRGTHNGRAGPGERTIEPGSARFWRVVVDAGDG